MEHSHNLVCRPDPVLWWVGTVDAAPSLLQLPGWSGAEEPSPICYRQLAQLIEAGILLGGTGTLYVVLVTQTFTRLQVDPVLQPEFHGLLPLPLVLLPVPYSFPTVRSAFTRVTRPPS